MILNYNKTVFRYNVLKCLFISLLLYTISSVVYSRNIREEPPPIRERLFFGGNFGLQFGTITEIQVSPVIGFWVLPRMAVALGPDYRFYKYRDVRTSTYGGKGYLQYVVLRDINSVIPLGVHTGIFLHIEDELLNLESSYWKNPPFTSERFYVNSVLAGGGISQQLGTRSSLNIMVLWVLNESGYDIYSNPVIRFSFNF
jgi:hypothetical protein